jgi:hypothetical protein
MPGRVCSGGEPVTAIDLIGEHQDDGISLSAPVIMELIEAVHEKGAPFRFQARGYSMKPAIRDGDQVTLSPLGDLPVGCGAVLAFRHPERPQMLVHRVLRKKGNRLFIRGDNAPDADGWIPVENILGLITRVERKGKTVFWPDRRHAWARFYFRFYSVWPPTRRLLVRIYHFFNK